MSAINQLPTHDLENDRLFLTTFISSAHGQRYVDGGRNNHEMYQHLSVGPFDSVDQLTTDFLEGIVKPGGISLFAIFDKTKPSEAAGEKGKFAGVISYLNTSVSDLQTEIGWITVLPEFQRTHVTTNAVGLLLHYALDLPSAGGLGMRRVVWKTNSMNTGSARVAHRMGFTKEGILRWDKVWPEGKAKVGNGRILREGDPRDKCLGRDTLILSLCWEEWEAGLAGKVDEIMSRME